MKKAAFCTAFCGTLLLLTGAAGAYGADLKSAAELAAALQAKIGKNSADVKYYILNHSHLTSSAPI